MQVGDIVWKYDSSARGEKFIQQYIVGETKISWIICGFPDPSESLLKKCEKIKKSEANDKLFTSQEEIEKYKWTLSAGYRLSDKIKYMGRRPSDYDKLKRIESILNEE